MVQYLGDFAEDATVYIPFNTFTSDDPAASATITNLADADIKVHKDGSATQIVTDGATVAIDFDSITGNHLITIDTSADAAYSTGSDYMVRIEGTTVDAGTINAWVGSFSIENRQASVNGISTLLTDVSAILTDTGTTLPATLSTIDGKVDTVDTVVDGIVTDIAALNDISTADVNAQVVDVFRTDTTAEMSQGAPPASPTAIQMLNYLYREYVRNKVVVDTDTANQKQVFADDGTTILYEKGLTNASDVTTIAEATTGA